MRLAFALLTAALVAWSARPLLPGYVAWIAFVPLLLALLRTRRPVIGGVLGWFAGLGAGIVAFEGVAPVEFVAYPILVALTALPLAVASGFMVLLARRLGRGAALALFPALLVTATFLPAQPWLLGPFADTISSVATTQVDTPLRLVAAWSGGSAVVLLLAIVNAGVAALALRERRWVAAGAITVALAVPWLPVPGRIVPAEDGVSLDVAIAQGAVPSVESLLGYFDDEAAERVLTPYANLTRQAAERGADLVIWGETVLPRPLEPGDVPTRVSEALAPAAVALVGGISYVAPDTFNAIFHWADGVLTEVYRKRALVPLNEAQYTPGIALPPLDVNGVAVGMGICLDSVVPPLARDAVRAGARMLVYLTDDAFAGRTILPELHLRHTALRAVETGRWVVFSNQSGPSGFIDPYGRIVERLPYGLASGAIVSVPSLRGVTPYVRFGDGVGIVASLVTLGFVAISLRRRSQVESHVDETTDVE